MRVVLCFLVNLNPELKLVVSSGLQMCFIYTPLCFEFLINCQNLKIRRCMFVICSTSQKFWLWPYMVLILRRQPPPEWAYLAHVVHAYALLTAAEI